METMKTTTKEICALAVGVALFVVFSLCLQVPVFENYYLCLGYIVVAAYCYSFGALKGSLVGFLGVIVYCFITNGLRGMPGWSLGNIVIGVVVGLACKLTRNYKNAIARYIIISMSIVLSTAVAILGVKSIVECVLYSQPFFLRAINNSYAFIADVFVLIISLPICSKMHEIIKRYFPELSSKSDNLTK